MGCSFSDITGGKRKQDQAGLTGQPTSPNGNKRQSHDGHRQTLLSSTDHDRPSPQQQRHSPARQSPAATPRGGQPAAGPPAPTASTSQPRSQSTAPSSTRTSRRPSQDAPSTSDTEGLSASRARQPSMSTTIRQLFGSGFTSLGLSLKRLSQGGAPPPPPPSRAGRPSDSGVSEKGGGRPSPSTVTRQPIESVRNSPQQLVTGKNVPLALSDRAVSLKFLELLIDLKVGNRKLGDMFTHEVVSAFVKPATADCKVCYIEALRRGDVRLPWTMVDEAGVVRFAVTGNRAVAPSTYFVSHAWSYRFKDLVELVRQHAAASEEDPEKMGYWLDILAVSQNFTGKFENHCDGDFRSVIQASRGLLLTIYPFVQPKTPTRVWCLFEVINAVELRKPLDLVLDPLFGKTRAYDDKQSLTQVGSAFESSVIKGLDVSLAEATVQADKTMILGLVRNRPGGIPQFNEILKKAMRSAVYDALLVEAVYRGDATSAESFIAAGAKVRVNSVSPPAALLAGASKVLVSCLQSGSPIQGIHFVGSTAPGSGGINLQASAMLSTTIARLLEAIEASKTVTHLTLSKLNLSDVEAKLIARFIAKVNCPLQSVDISGNNFAEEGIVALTHGLADNYSRTGRLTSFCVDMPRGGAGRDRDALRAALLAASPHATWAGGRTAGTGGGAAGGSGGSSFGGPAERSSANPLGSARGLGAHGRSSSGGRSNRGTLPPIVAGPAASSLRPTPPRTDSGGRKGGGLGGAGGTSGGGSGGGGALRTGSMLDRDSAGKTFAKVSLGTSSRLGSGAFGGGSGALGDNKKKWRSK